MDNNVKVSNPNDFKVVQFQNTTDFDFTPEMGCMYDGRPISGTSGVGIKAGESTILPYHIAHRLATNLAKQSFIRGDTGKPQLDAQGAPIVKSMWDDAGLDNHKNSFLKELYSEEKPIAMTETDRLMAKVDEYKSMVDKLLNSEGKSTPEPEKTTTVVTDNNTSESTDSFADKSDVIAELEKRGIVHDKRKSKAELEKLLA